MKPESGGNIVAIVAAGGAGDRAGFAAPKQFAPVGGVPMLARAVAPLVASAEIAVVCVAVASAESERARAVLRDFSLVKILPVGKQTRARTVRAAVCESCADDDWALVHDAARPFLPPELLVASRRRREKKQSRRAAGRAVVGRAQSRRRKQSRDRKRPARGIVLRANPADVSRRGIENGARRASGRRRRMRGDASRRILSRGRPRRFAQCQVDFPVRL